MGSILVDASALLAVLLAERKRVRIVEATRGADLVAPACIPWEIGNALSALMKRRRLGLDQAKELYTRFAKISVRLVDVDFANALAIADRYGLYAYDAYYLECAHRLRFPLLTLDAGMGAAAAEIGIVTLEVS